MSVDERWRIQLPKDLREKWDLRPRQPLVIEVKEHSAEIRKLSRMTAKADPLLKEFRDHPLKGARISKKVLDALEETMWLP